MSKSAVRRLSRKSKMLKLDNSKPPVRGAYRHPDGSWILLRSKDDGRYRISAVKHNDEIDATALAQLLYGHLRAQQLKAREEAKEQQDTNQAAA